MTGSALVLRFDGMDTLTHLGEDGSGVGDDYAGLMISALSVFAGVNLWWNFSGPFRWLVVLELERFGRYSEPITGWIVVVGCYFAAWFVELAIRRLLRGRGRAGTGSAIAMTVSAVGFVLMGTVLLVQAWQLLAQHLQLPVDEGPRRVVDLGRIGPESLPEGPVRVIGMPDRARLSTLYTRPGSRTRAGWWDEYAPVIADAAGGADAPIRLLVTVRRSDIGDPGPGITDDLQGRLVNDALRGRVLYQLRERGLDVSERTAVLYSPGGIAMTFKMELGVLMVGAFALLILGLWATREALTEWTASTTDAVVRIAQTPPAPMTSALGSVRFRFGGGLSLLGLAIVGGITLMTWMMSVAPLLVVGPILIGLVWTGFFKPRRRDRS
ncbi:hypothetical protein BH10PSE17_BH10PSE17_09430 [soil metagenome]